MKRKEIIVAWLKDYLEASGAEGFVIGLSGGVDSTLAAALAAEAAGPEKVLGVCMPCHSDAKDEGLARQVARWLGITLLKIDLGKAYDMLESIMPAPSLPQNRIAPPNMKARLRMVTLYRIANARSLLVLGTGDKSEAAVGYFTKYGDGGVDLLPIGDLYKTEVQAMAREMGAPLGVTERPPSAGLWPGQTDEGEMGITYTDLDSALVALDDPRFLGPDDDIMCRVVQMRVAAMHKLVMPPICTLGAK